MILTFGILTGCSEDNESPISEVQQTPLPSQESIELGEIPIGIEVEDTIIYNPEYQTFHSAAFLSTMQLFEELNFAGFDVIAGEMIEVNLGGQWSEITLINMDLYVSSRLTLLRSIVTDELNQSEPHRIMWQNISARTNQNVAEEIARGNWSMSTEEIHSIVISFMPYPFSPNIQVNFSNIAELENMVNAQSQDPLFQDEGALGGHNLQQADTSQFVNVANPNELQLILAIFNFEGFTDFHIDDEGFLRVPVGLGVYGYVRPLSDPPTQSEVVHLTRVASPFYAVNMLREETEIWGSVVGLVGFEFAREIARRNYNLSSQAGSAEYLYRELAFWLPFFQYFGLMTEEGLHNIAGTAQYITENILEQLGQSYTDPFSYARMEHWTQATMVVLRRWLMVTGNLNILLMEMPQHTGDVLTFNDMFPVMVEHLSFRTGEHDLYLAYNLQYMLNELSNGVNPRPEFSDNNLHWFNSTNLISHINMLGDVLFIYMNQNDHEKGIQVSLLTTNGIIVQVGRETLYTRGLPYLSHWPF